jgi:hypothetical protein
MFSYGDAKTKLTGPDATRRLESNSGAMMRDARRLRRQGFGRAAEQMALGAAQSRAEERPESGPRWKSYETKQEEQQIATEVQDQNNARMSKLMSIWDRELAKRNEELNKPTTPIPFVGPPAPATPSAVAPTTPTPVTKSVPFFDLKAIRPKVGSLSPVTAPPSSLAGTPGLTYAKPSVIASTFRDKATQDKVGKRANEILASRLRGGSTMAKR